MIIWYVHLVEGMGGGMNIINVSPLHILGISFETICGSHSFHTLPTLPFWNLLTPNKLTKFMKLGNMKPRCQRHCLTNHMITIHFSWRWRWIPRAGDHFSESSRNTSRPLPLLVRACQLEWVGRMRASRFPCCVLSTTRTRTRTMEILKICTLVVVLPCAILRCQCSKVTPPENAGIQMRTMLIFNSNLASYW